MASLTHKEISEKLWNVCHSVNTKRQLVSATQYLLLYNKKYPCYDFTFGKACGILDAKKIEIELKLNTTPKI